MKNIFNFLIEIGKLKGKKKKRLDNSSNKKSRNYC